METNNTYWNSNGKYQAILDKLSPLIPDSGKCDNCYLELLRTAQNMYYDLYNNGLCNIEIVLPPFIAASNIYIDEIEKLCEKRTSIGFMRNGSKNYKIYEDCMNAIIQLVDKNVSYVSITDSPTVMEAKESFKNNIYALPPESENTYVCGYVDGVIAGMKKMLPQTEAPTLTRQDSQL